MPSDERLIADVALAGLESFESLVDAGDGDLQLGEVTSEAVQLKPERAELGADPLEPVTDLLAFGAHLGEQAEESAGEKDQDRPGLGVVHPSRIVHSPRAVERQPCNYGGVR